MRGKEQELSGPSCLFRPRLIALLVVGALAGTVPVAQAQLAQVRPDAGQLLEQQRKQQLPAPFSDRDILPQEEQQPRPALRGTSSLKVSVQKFRITGNRVFSEEDLLTAVKDQLGKDLDFDGLNDAALAVRSYYRARGYFLAQAYLPAQQIRNGVVEIAILEGRVGNVSLKMDPKTRLRPEFAQGVLDNHLKTGDLITETGLERPLLLLSDLPNVVVSSEIGPSTKAIGSADLRVNIKEGDGVISGYADLTNSGNRYTGQWTTGVDVSANNLSGFGDQLSLRATLTNEQMSFVRAAVTAPVGYGGTRAGISYAQFNYKLERDFASLRAHGEGSVLSLYALHPFVRTRNANLIGQASMENKLLKDRIDSTSGLEDRTINTFKLGLVGDLRDRVFGGGLNSYSISYTEGTVNIYPASVLATDQSAAGLKTQGKFAKVNFDVRRLQLVTQDINLLFALSGQIADRNLTAAEKMSLGGANGVRGYPAGQAGGDQGFLFSTELRYIVPKVQILSGDISLSGFYDAGRVKVAHSPLRAATNPNFLGISSYGVGLSLGKDRDFLLRTSIAWRGENDTPDADVVRRSAQVWFHGIKWF